MAVGGIGQCVIPSQGDKKPPYENFWGTSQIKTLLSEGIYLTIYTTLQRFGAMGARTSFIARFLSPSHGGLLVLCLLSLPCGIGVRVQWRLRRLLLLRRRISRKQICRGIRVRKRSPRGIDRIRLRHLRWNGLHMGLLVPFLLSENEGKNAC